MLPGGWKAGSTLLIFLLDGKCGESQGDSRKQNKNTGISGFTCISKIYLLDLSFTGKPFQASNKKSLNINIMTRLDINYASAGSWSLIS